MGGSINSYGFFLYLHLMLAFKCRLSVAARIVINIITADSLPVQGQSQHPFICMPERVD